MKNLFKGYDKLVKEMSQDVLLAIAFANTNRF